MKVDPVDGMGSRVHGFRPKPLGRLELSKHCPRPSCGGVGEGLSTAASALWLLLLLFSRPKRRSLSLLVQWSPASHLEFVVPQALWRGGCFIPAGVEPESHL